MEDKKSFGEFITQKMKESRLTQKSFAEKIFVTELVSILKNRKMI
ncbi:hypothetical protein [Clostridium estertheticum]|nr:hypothetical protein [Clostridium estertheticum]